jgi:hypothetical protein
MKNFASWTFLFCIGLAAVLTAQMRNASITIIPPTTGLAVGNLYFAEARANGVSTIGLHAPLSVPANVNFQLPAADGTANQCIQTDGAANLSFGTCGGVSVTNPSTPIVSTISGGNTINISCPTCIRTTGSPSITGTQIVASGGTVTFQSGSNVIWGSGVSISVNGNIPLTQTTTVRNAAGTGTCTNQYYYGMLINTTC